MKDTFKTISSPSPEVLFKDRSSKFYGNAFPFMHSNEFASHLSNLKNLYHKAGHHCYAYSIGIDGTDYRANDDGEPNHSAGDPILGQVRAYDLTNILIVVSRIYGGTKLGVSGLINAYKTAAAMAIEQSNVVTQIITQDILISFNYPQTSMVMRFIEENNLKIIEQNLTMNCKITVAAPASQSVNLTKKLNGMFPIKASLLG